MAAFDVSDELADALLDEIEQLGIELVPNDGTEDHCVLTPEDYQTLFNKVDAYIRAYQRYTVAQEKLQREP